MYKPYSMITAVDIFINEHTEETPPPAIQLLSLMRDEQLDREQLMLVALAMLRKEVSETGTDYAKKLVDDLVDLLEQVVHAPIAVQFEEEHLEQLEDGSWMLIPNDIDEADELMGLKIPPGASA